MQTQAVKTMKALQLYGARQMKYEEVEMPAYGPDEVLIKVHNVGVCATDLEIYQGEMVYFLTGQATFPIIPGHEWAGEIVEVGENVVGYSPGDRVVGETTISCGRCKTCLKGQYNLCPDRVENGVMKKNGACAEYMAYPAHALHKFDRSIPFDKACLIEPAAVSFRGVKRLNVTPEDTVAIVGAGPVGLLAVQAAKSYGARKVVLIDMRKNRLDMGLQLGCDEVIDLSYQDLEETASLLTEGEMFTRIIEATGNTDAIGDLTKITAPGSRVVLLGLCGGKQASIDVDHIVTNDLDVCGSLASPGVWDSVVRLLEDGEIETEKLITHRFPVDEMEKAFELMEKKDPSIVKIVLDVAK
ncbi:alcohol dehydrogenase catalytic domain-containing protein [bacterium LRH843]|nr:alcohol dehydrogenase catalytic domain-containing protein [bacterium LRH843]